VVPEALPAPAPPPPEADPQYALDLKMNILHQLMSKKILEMHTHKYMKESQIETAIGFVCEIVESTLEIVEWKLKRDAPAAAGTIETVATNLRATLSTFLDSSHAITTAMKSIKEHVEPIERPLGRGELSERLETKGELAVFSLKALLKRVLQDSTARKLIIAESDRWKTGDLYQQVPEVMKDLTDGTRFRNRVDLCGRSDDPKELRIVTVGWEDDFTVRCSLAAQLYLVASVPLSADTWCFLHPAELQPDRHQARQPQIRRVPQWHPQLAEAYAVPPELHSSRRNLPGQVGQEKRR
jgi:hypothetical protein